MNQANYNEGAHINACQHKTTKVYNSSTNWRIRYDDSPLAIPFSLRYQNRPTKSLLGDGRGGLVACQNQFFKMALWAWYKFALYISTNDDTLWASIVIENTIYQPHHTSIEHCRMIRFVL